MSISVFKPSLVSRLVPAYVAVDLLQVIFYLLVFLTLDPITKQLWECTNPADAACAAVWQAPSPIAFCSMSQAQWKWTNTGACWAGWHHAEKGLVNIICPASAAGCMLLLLQHFIWHMLQALNSVSLAGFRLHACCSLRPC